MVQAHRRLGLIVDQAFAGSTYAAGEAWRAAAEAGAAWLSITEEALGITPERVAELRRDAERAGTPVLLTTCHAFGLGDPRDAVRAFNLDRACRHVDVTRELGTDRMKVLLGEWVWRTMWPDEAQWALLVAEARRLAAYAERRRVVLSVELEPLATSLVNDVASLERLLDDVASPALRANVDTSHMVVRGVPAADIRRLGHRVDSVDFSDSNGSYHEHLPPGAGVADLAAFVAELAAAGGDDMLVAVEVGPFGDPENAYAKVLEAMARTRQLFAGATA